MTMGQCIHYSLTDEHSGCFQCFISNNAAVRTLYYTFPFTWYGNFSGHNVGVSAVSVGFYFMKVTERWHGKANANEGKFLLLTSWTQGGLPCHAWPHGEAPGLVRRRMGWGEGMAQKLNCVFWKKGKAGQRKSLGLTDLNSVSRLWPIEVVSRCLEPSPGWLGERSIASWSITARWRR